jgi:tetratricopeptide (TPR) repeat protein
MRLLYFDALGRLVLTDFRGKTIPPYAILSHRWSDAEILIEDVSSGTYKEKDEGYRKLAFCANQAARDELQYFWIDTCCIDRWNLRERSKAINSMFQWYKDATRCYVFLSDVSVSTATEPVQRSDWEASFRASAWFTRGWTLQELIAPVAVEFFSCEGHRIGDKETLDQLIHDITAMPLAALRNCPLHEFSTSERRRWVENRRTKEEEDIVYCMLGILDVSMPTTYGEGEESARSRLQAELEGASDAPSIVPFSRNPRFVGRESQLAELEAKLFSNDKTTTTLAIVGPGGTGKSQLALEVAHRTRQNKENCSVFWMDASDKDSLYQSYASIAQKLRVPGWDDDLVNIKQLAKRCVVKISARQCLLIFDNTEDATLRSGGLFTTEAADLVDYLPQSRLCSVIFTTNNSDTAQALASQNIVALQGLTPDKALGMLQTRLPMPLSNLERQEAMHLLRELSYLPLAVMQAAACMNASGVTMQEYRSRLDEHRELATKHSGDSSEGEQRDSSVRDPVAATLLLSIHQIRYDNALAAAYLCFAACFDQKDILLDLLKASSVQEREDAVRVLNKYALVTRRPAQSALDVHRLVHQALRKQLQVQGRYTHWIQRAITQLLQVFPDNDHSNRSKWRRLFPHVQYALSHSLNDQKGMDRMNLAWKCAEALLSDGRYKESEKLFVQAMETHKKIFGDDHPNTLTLRAGLAVAYRNQGELSKAQQLATQVMEKRKAVIGAEHPDTLKSMANVALIFWSQKKFKEAEELGLRVMQTRMRVLEPDHPDTLTSMANLAVTYVKLQRFNEAEKLNMEVMEKRTKVLGPEHRDTLISMGNQAEICFEQGRRKEVKKLLLQVVEMFTRKFGEDYPDTLGYMANLALVYSYQGLWTEAKELLVQVMQARMRVLGDKHPDTQSSLDTLSSWEAEQDDGPKIRSLCILFKS